MDATHMIVQCKQLYRTFIGTGGPLIEASAAQVCDEGPHHTLASIYLCRLVDCYSSDRFRVRGHLQDMTVFFFFFFLKIAALLRSGGICQLLDSSKTSRKGQGRLTGLVATPTVITFSCGRPLYISFARNRKPSATCEFLGVWGNQLPNTLKQSVRSQMLKSSQLAALNMFHCFTAMNPFKQVYTAYPSSCCFCSTQQANKQTKQRQSDLFGV